MSRPAFLFRPDLRKDDHRQAWEMLDAQPSGFKNEFLTQAILCTKRQEALESMLRRVIIEQLGNVTQVNAIKSLTVKHPLQIQQCDANSMPKFMMDFLGELD